ncbi:hypothetical protein TrVE_jg13318 [Triparma verrucosa]|uniref:O-GlcNAc transferase C-terminal domain-containing protein n=1 Tax=Triparma verrucosa TaxID=1606542 RepID=A0A9W7CDQ5_9STRA|nr:hypothetical protein TrVE_jg13318 [Triparma verrucosa]
MYDTDTSTINRSEASSNLFNTKGVIHKGLLDFPKSLLAFDLAEELDDTGRNFNAFYNRANCLHYSFKHPVGAEAVEAFLSSPSRRNFVGDMESQFLQAAVADYEKADLIIRSVGDPDYDYASFSNDYAICLRKLRDSQGAIEVLLRAVAHSPDNLFTRGNLVIALKDARNLAEAAEHSRVAIELDPANAQIRHNYGLVLQEMGESGREQWEAALELDKDIYHSLSSIGHDEGNRGNLTGAVAMYSAALDVVRRIGATEEIGSLQIQIATACIPPIYESTAHITKTRESYIVNLSRLLDQEASSENEIYDPLTSTGSGSLGYYIIYQGKDDVEVRRLLAKVYWKHSPSLVVPPPPQMLLPPLPLPPDRAKIHVGFHSAFFFRHSVGLLMEGVISNIDRERYHVTVFIQTPEDLLKDDVYMRITAGADVVVELPGNLEEARELISSYNLDLLVYGEVGMDTMGYYLPFSRLAKRTALFWGHALSSGIANHDGRVATGLDAEQVGGVDYFVTSTMFEAEGERARSPQDRYSETIYMMDGLTTHFMPPMAPRPNVDLAYFGLPTDHSNNIYLCPQTLYKLHPDFDALIVNILKMDPNGIVVFPVAVKVEWTESLMDRMLGGEAGEFRDRIIFVRRLDFNEFIALAKLANVVLDPFPVGGGRSSLEIFSTGTPIVMPYHRTNILQLTFGMYKTMRILDLVCYNDEDYVKTAVAVGTNRDMEQRIRSAILTQNHLLYQSPKVIEEWNEFIHYAVSNPRPVSNGYFSLAVKDSHLDHNHKSIELSGGATLAYAVKLNHDNPVTGQSHGIMVHIAIGEDPLEYARQLAESIGAEPVKFRWIATLLQRGVKRLERGIIDSVMLVVKGKEVLVGVRWGDDLALVASFAGIRHGLNDEGISWLREVLEMRVPQHVEASWIRSRRELDALIVGDGVDGVDGEDGEDGGKYTHGQEGCFLTVAITTCKRLPLFIKTVDSFLSSLGGVESASRSICAFLVVDDSSSEQDRLEMQSRYPSFNFYWKSEDEKGHAKSMNIILNLVKTRYLMYLEDDWQFLVPPSSGPTRLITEPMTVLSTTSCAQVLLNDQSSRFCAYASPISSCLDSGNVGKAGWNRGEYVEHEFGTVHPLHEFTYWPGFSLNPGIWDLRRLRRGLEGVGERFVFDHEDERFEQSFSVKCLNGGLDFAHLPRINVRHIGTEVSSYVLNGLERDWD